MPHRFPRPAPGAACQPALASARPGRATGRRAVLLGLAGGLLGAALPGPLRAAAQYPSQPLTFIVPYAPGGQGDVFARLIADPLGQALGQTVIVDNRPGASGSIGTRLVARAAADGHTLLLGQTGEIAVNVFAMQTPGYDPLKDLKPVVLVGDAPLVLAVPANSPYPDLGALLEAAAQRPEQLSYASSGAATPGHLAAAALALGTQTRMVHVPYKGAGQAMTDLLGGHVDFFFSSASAAMPHVKAGKLRVLAVSTAQRLAALPQVPTVAESVLPGFQFSLWGGVFVPAGTPDEIVARLNREINAIVAQPAIRQRFEADNAAVQANTPEAFRQFVQAETGKYRDLVSAVGIEPV
ncbi:tripartite tricarboxylate transporter substrate binding protein [Orrella sp. JC864]|uniref:Bug family tripartite tricarboxylate transporter substrate binding protein n=1 Tax=Orrella sp. JC864 TaxID=3120298 RepID=UPI003009BCA6